MLGPPNFSSFSLGKLENAGIESSGSSVVDCGFLGRELILFGISLGLSKSRVGLEGTGKLKAGLCGDCWAGGCLCWGCFWPGFGTKTKLFKLGSSSWGNRLSLSLAGCLTALLGFLKTSKQSSLGFSTHSYWKNWFTLQDLNSCLYSMTPKLFTALGSLLTLKAPLSMSLLQKLSAAQHSSLCLLPPCSTPNLHM